MGRKKKQDSEKNKDSNPEKKSRPMVHGDVKRSIVAIFLFALSVLFVLSFFESAAVLGDYLDGALSSIFGWGKWVSPIFLSIVGVILLFRKETLFYVAKIVGLFVSFLSVLGFFHVYFEEKELLLVAEKGEGGGYIGYAIAYVLDSLAGKVAGSVILGSMFLIGMILAFNFSLAAFIRGLFAKKEEEIEDAIEEGKDPNKIEYVKGPEAETGEAKAAENKIDFIKKKITSMPLRKKTTEEELSQNMMAAGDSDWELPPIDLLESSTGKALGGDVEKNAEIIQATLKSFGIDVEPGEIKTGPTITQYSFRPAVGIKLSKITGLGNDLALALAAHPIRIEAPIPGKSLIGIEVPNKSVATVCLKELLQSDVFKSRKSNLTLFLGKDVNGGYIAADLQKMPHLLIAGSTGSGKSVCANTILLSLLYQNSPEDLKLILVDPKRVELSLYNGIPHLLADVIVDNHKVINALRWAISEMESRYKILQKTGSKDLNSYMQKFAKGEKYKTLDSETNEMREESMKRLPNIVIMVDELADLMMAHGKEVEGAIIRLAQMARAVGIHLILSTQKPVVNVITGLIKSNIPTRIAFKVPALMDSRTILDASGAERLLGNGDMLYTSTQFAGLKRLQGVFVSEDEVKRIVKFIKKQKIEKGEEDLGEDITGGSGQSLADHGGTNNGEKIDFGNFQEENSDGDERLYEEAKKVVMEAKKASTSLLQRRLRLGYARAARMMDLLEQRGVVGPQDGIKQREVYFSSGDTTYEDSIDDQMKRDKWQM